MILDQFGRPASVFFRSDAYADLFKDFADAPACDWDAECRVQNLRDSMMDKETQLQRRGSTITVRLPRRYQVERDHVEGDVRVPWSDDPDRRPSPNAPPEHDDVEDEIPIPERG